MAWIIGDSFDFYGSIADLGASGLWDSAPAGDGLSSATSRFSSGQYLFMSAVTNKTHLVKASGSNDATHHIVFAYRCASGGNNVNGFSVQLLDGTSVQMSLAINPLTGSITFYSGDFTTLLGTWAASIIHNGVTWTALEFEVTIHNTTGAIHGRLNGNTVDDYVLTGVNTRGGTTNNYANKIQVGVAASMGASPHLDDFLWFSTSGAAPNTWVGDVRAEQKMPLSVASTSGMTVSPTTIALTDALTHLAGFNYGPGSTNRVSFSPLVAPGISGSLTNVSIVFAATFTGHYRIGIYDGAAGTPGTLLAQSAEQTNAVIGTVTVALTAPLALTAASKFFIAVLADAAVSVTIAQGSNAIPTPLTQTYASGLPASGGNSPIQAASSQGVNVLATVVPDLAYGVGQAISDGDTSFAYSASVGANDFYNLTPLISTPLSIIAVQTRLQMRKSDTATRQARIQIKSGGTTSSGSTATLSSSYTYVNKLDTVDPNTSAAWAAAAVNSLQIGEYVVA